MGQGSAFIDHRAAMEDPLLDAARVAVSSGAQGWSWA